MAKYWKAIRPSGHTDLRVRSDMTYYALDSGIWVVKIYIFEFSSNHFKVWNTPWCERYFKYDTFP